MNMPLRRARGKRKCCFSELRPTFKRFTGLQAAVANIVADYAAQNVANLTQIGSFLDFAACNGPCGSLRNRNFTFFESVDAKATCAAIAGVIVLALSLVYYLWVKFGMLLVNASSRNNEYAADAFAVDCGFGAGLYSALSQLDPSKTRSGFFSLLASSHPDTVARLEKIRLRLGASAQAATTAI